MFKKSRYYRLGRVLDILLIMLFCFITSVSIPLGIVTILVYFVSVDQLPSKHIKEYYESRVDVEEEVENRVPRFTHFVGERALTETCLSPHGFITVKDEKIDALVLSGFLPAQSTVIIVEAKSYYVVVEAV